MGSVHADRPEEALPVLGLTRYGHPYQPIRERWTAALRPRCIRWPSICILEHDHSATGIPPERTLTCEQCPLCGHPADTPFAPRSASCRSSTWCARRGTERGAPQGGEAGICSCHRCAHLPSLMRPAFPPLVVRIAVDAGFIAEMNLMVYPACQVAPQISLRMAYVSGVPVISRAWGLTRGAVTVSSTALAHVTPTLLSWTTREASGSGQACAGNENALMGAGSALVRGAAARGARA
jgi:hypothetical protein